MKLDIIIVILISDTVALAKQHYSDKIELENEIDDDYMLNKSDCLSGREESENKFLEITVLITCKG